MTECLTVSPPVAGEILGVGRNAAYEAIKRGEIPAIRIGRKLRVPKAALQRMLDRTATDAARATIADPRRGGSAADGQ